MSNFYKSITSKDNLKMAVGVTLSSVILINCYASLINNLVKKDKKIDSVNKDEYKVNTTYVSLEKTPYDMDNNIMALSLDEEVDNNTFNKNVEISKEDIINTMGEILTDDRKLELQTEIEVYKNLVDLGIITPEPTFDDKLNFILENNDLTLDQFNTIKGIVLAEAGDQNYEEAYAVTNTIFNRTICKRWVDSVNKRVGNNKGTNLYYQVIQPSQFSVYSSGAYKLFINETPESSTSVQAIYDFLYGTFTKDENYQLVWNGPARLHNKLNFVGNWVIPKYPYIMFNFKGNRHGVDIEDYELLSNKFTQISEDEVEEMAVRAKEYINDCQRKLTR